MQRGQKCISKGLYLGWCVLFSFGSMQSTSSIMNTIQQVKKYLGISMALTCLIGYVGVVFSNMILPSFCREQQIALAITSIEGESPWDLFVQQLRVNLFQALEVLPGRE